MKRKVAEELFYSDDTGKKQSQYLHDPILKEGNANAASSVSRAVMRGQGFSETEIATLLGKEPNAKAKALLKSKAWSDRAEFMDQCIITITEENGGDEDDALDTCEQLWEDGADISDFE